MRVLLIIIILLLAPVYLFAGVDGKIAGTVTDKITGEPLVGANVVVVGTSLGASTDINGRYHILRVPVGTYSVRSNYIGFTGVLVENIQVASDLTSNLDFEMTSAAIEGEEVVIIAERPLVNLSATNAVRTADAEFIENIATRDVEDIYALQAGVVVQNNEVFIRGGRSDETGYMLEGIATNAVVGANLGTNDFYDNQHIASDNTVNVIAEALEEVKLLSGGYSAETGGAVSGIVQQSLRTGSSKFRGGFQYETDSPAESFGNTISYGYNDVTATLGGPLGSTRFFLAVEKYHKDDYAPMFFTGYDLGYMLDNGQSGGTVDDSAYVKWDGGKISGRNDDRLTFNGSYQIDLNPLVLRFSGARTSRERILNNRPTFRIFNEGRLRQRDDMTLLLNSKASYFISSNTILDANVGIYRYDWRVFDPNFSTNGEFDIDEVLLYGDSAAVSAVNPDWVYDSRTTAPSDYNFAGFTFQRPGDIITGYRKREQSYLNLSANLQSQIGNQEVKLGGAFRTWTVRQYYFPNTAVISLNSQMATDASLRANIDERNDEAAKILRRSGVGGIGYDDFGAEVNSGSDDAKRPKFISGYINDKLEVRDIIVNAGIRVDYFDLDTWHLADSANPGFDEADESVFDSVLVKADASTIIQPRMGLAFPISERTVFHLQFGKFAQAPDLGDAYSSRSQMATVFGGQNYINDPIGFDLKPIITTQYEIGFNHQFHTAASFDITAFYKNTEGQLTIARYDVAPDAPGNDYHVYVNGDFAVIKGLEVTLRTRRVQRFMTMINYTLSDARGTNSFPNSQVSGLENNSETPTMITPLTYEQKHRGSINLDYRFMGNDDGPMGLLANSGVNLLLNFNSGHRYTASDGSMGQRAVFQGALLTDGDPRNRSPREPIGDSTTPWVFTTDMKLDKMFKIGKLEASVYMFVSNLFNRRNVLNVYNRTGDAYEDGFLTDPELSQQVVAGLGQDYVDLYRAINLDNRQHWLFDMVSDLFSPPREIHVGFKLNF